MTKESQHPLAFPKNEIRDIPLDQIEPDKDQIRKEFDRISMDALEESIKAEGLKYPIIVTAGEDGKYRIVDGERRWRAHKMLVKSSKKRFATIRAIFENDESQLLGILGNIARSSYNPMETADAYALIKKILGQDGKDVKDEDVAKYVGKSRSIVVEYNSLLKLPKEIQERARKHSCVPFNKLKKLAANPKMSDEEKIAAYDDLWDKYTDTQSHEPEEQDDKQPQSRETRSVIAVRKKLDTMKEALGGVQFTDKVDGQEKENFLKSLQEIIETAQAVQQKLSS